MTTPFEPSPAGSKGPRQLDLAALAVTAGRRLKAHGPALGANALAGLVASLLTLAYCLSFSALIFQGDLEDGLPRGLWALLVGSAIAGLYVALTTSLPPAEAGPDNPAVAVLSVLAATVAGQVSRAGGNAPLAIDYVLLAFSLTTLITGLVLYLLGRLRLGRYVRFIPYPVIAGFLAASGWFLIIGGFEVMTGTDLTLANLASAVPADRAGILVVGFLFAAGLFAMKTLTGSMYVLPIALISGTVLLDIALWIAGLQAGSGWFLATAAHPSPWVPLASLFADPIDPFVFIGAATEIGAVAGVTVIALLLDVTGLEVARSKSADLDWEFRTNGVANMLAAPLGGVMGNLSLNGSRLLEETGGLARASGVFASLVVVLVVVTGLDLPSLVPAPVLAGLLIYLGLVVLTDVLLRSPAHRAWTDFGLALAIMAAIVTAGYLAGIVFGLIAACLMFAVNYGRISVIRRHLTRAVIASNVERSSGASQFLQQEGGRIHVFWLSGFIFFGSSNGLYERILAVMAEGCPKRRFAVLDFADVSGFDTSAVMSLVKLRNYATAHGVSLAFAGLSPRMALALDRLMFFEGSRHSAFPSRNAGLEWCENEVLAGLHAGEERGAQQDFEQWLAAEVGGIDKARRLAKYFERRDIEAGAVLYEQGSPAKTIDLVVSGTLALTVRGEPGTGHLMRRMSTRTVVGEMGFFRSLPRTATIAAEGHATIYSLSEERFHLLKTEDPEIAGAFLEFIVRALSDRLDFANHGLAALS